MSLKSPNAAIERGAYSAIVYMDGDLCVAEDSVGTIIKESTNAAAVFQAAIDLLGNRRGHITLSEGTFSLSSALDFPYYHVSSYACGIVFQGQGNATVINYTPSTGYALSLSAEAASDSKGCSNHSIQDLSILAPNTTDGAILFEGASRNIITNVKIECANGNAIKMKKNTYGSPCVLNTFNKVDIRQNTKCCLYGIDDSQAVLNNCCFIAGTPDGIYFNGGILWFNNTEVEGTTNAINRVDGITSGVNLYNDGGDLLFDGGKFKSYGGNIQFFKPSNDCDYEISSSHNAGHLHIAFPQIAPPFDFINRGVQCNLELDGFTGFGTTVDDVDASNGKARKNTDANAAGYVFLHRYKHYNYLPRGKYLLLVRLKDTHAVTGQARVIVWNSSDSNYPLSTDLTLTSSYKTYSFVVAIDSNDSTDDMRIGVYKHTTAENTIYADFYKLVYLGTEWEDFTVGGGHQLLLVDDIGSFPSATVDYRGMLAYDQGAAGVADTLKMCMKSTADTYSWKTVVTG